MMNWPNKKEFAFTIIDDTDNSTLDGNKKIYDFLDSLGFKTTKTVWVYPSRDSFTGVSLDNSEFCNYLMNLKAKGFELALHNVGSGVFHRNEIIQGLNEFKEKLGDYPNIHINHASNKDNIYWGYKRFNGILRLAFRLIYGNRRTYEGDEPASTSFWGDKHKIYIKYTRNYVFNHINTLLSEPKTPYIDKSKVAFSNYWFSSSDADSIDQFIGLLTDSNIKSLQEQNGACIIYTHFADGYLDQDGNLDKRFVNIMTKLSQIKSGWFVTASEILDYLESLNQNRVASKFYLIQKDFLWLRDRLIKKLTHLN